jgi:Uma2 family endonuclease
MAGMIAAKGGEKAMVTVQNELGQVSIPDWVVDLESFRRWADADDFPETGHIWFLKGEVWVDMTMEQVFTHLHLKEQFYIVLGYLTESEDRGLFLPDGLRLSNVPADISVNPDGTFVSYESIDAKRAVLVEGMEEGYLELEGSADMVLEVVSRSSVRKDYVILRKAYWEAGIREYWLVDARKEPLSFSILRHTANGYKAARKQDGWIKSAVFGKWFRLSQTQDRHGNPKYTLEVR